MEPMTVLRRLHFFLPLLLMPLLLVLGICAGSFWIAPAELLHPDPVAELRLIRMLAALTVGGSLSLSGMVFQAILRNPLAEPFILGVSGGAGVGSALAILSGLAAVSVLSLPLCALAGALAAFGLVLAISRRGQRGAENLLLSGVIVGTLAGSILMFLISIAGTDALAGITWWMLGDLQTADPRLLLPAAVVLVLTFGTVQFFSRGLNALALGDSEAWNLGVDTKTLTLVLVVAAALPAACSVSLAGVIGFCGLIVPHLARRIYGCDHRKLTPLAVFWGADFLMLCDILSRLPYPFKEIPIGVVTSLIGGPLFLWIINRRTGHED
ncbi:MAG: iron ABC transporter permease [Lentisphaeria bacterium]|nr:iron ABC transporter permease [Lentisphaeria bacterium]